MSIYEYDYEKHMKMEREQHFAEGLAQGREEGLAQGREEGLARGRSAGRNEGKYEEACENARRFFENGASYDLVKNSIIDLPEQELRKIYEERSIKDI